MSTAQSEIWRPLSRAWRRLAHPRAVMWGLRDGRWKRLLSNAALSIRLGRVDEAMDLLSPYLYAPIRDAAYFNLIGVLHEARHEWNLARKFYGKAMRADRHFAPAQQNMRRMYELYTFGKCREPIALGDETPGLWLAWGD